jgi:hypothetical protein
MSMVLIMLIGCFWGIPITLASASRETPAAVASESEETPAAVASESEETPAAVASEYNKYDQYDPDTNYCGDMGYLPADPNLTEAENRGRCTWYLYTAGNEKFYRKLNLTTGGRFVDLLQFLDSRKHDERFANYGVMNDPGCKKATRPDQYGLWLDECQDPKSTGVMGFRKFKNPNFVAAKWDAQKYSKDRTIEPPYRIGASCAVCHITFNPLNPPKDLENLKWGNLEPTLGNQYLEEGKLFAANLKADDFAKQVISAQPPGTSDTSRIGYDHINNPNTINSIFNLGDRPSHEEVMNDGHKEAVYHILKDGADSVGALTALKRVYVNIGSCSDYWLTLHEPFMGRTPQRPFDINKAREVCEDWRKTEELMPEMGLFLLSRKPLHLKDAPGGEAFLTKDESVLERGKVVFAQTCAQCHSSKKPPTEIAADPAKAQQWYIESVKSPDFLENNFLSDDERYPVTLISTNAARALATNAMKGHIWEQFSSKTYKEQPSPGKLTLYNPFNPNQPIEFQVPSGGPGYYRTPTLISIWATAPFFHNNALGIYNKDPSVEGRVNAYTDAMEKLLWPEKREGIISTTDRNSILELPLGVTTLRAPVPKGTPVNLLANINIREAIAELDIIHLLQDLRPQGGLKGKTVRVLLRANKSPDFLEDRGHTFGSQLSDEDKKALIEFVKTF